jgi:hypothetical protein
VVRIEIVRVTLEGTPSCVTREWLRVVMRSGESGVLAVPFPDGVMYEVLEDAVRAANRGYLG